MQHSIWIATIEALVLLAVCTFIEQQVFKFVTVG